MTSSKAFVQRRGVTCVMGCDGSSIYGDAPVAILWQLGHQHRQSHTRFTEGQMEALSKGFLCSCQNFFRSGQGFRPLTCNAYSEFPFKNSRPDRHQLTLGVGFMSGNRSSFIRVDKIGF